MVRFYGHNFFDGSLARKNWENDVSRVCVEACDCEEDPLGYRVVYFVDEEQEEARNSNNSFVVGASFLSQRQKNLSKSGYVAPMTKKAIALIERKIGHGLVAAA